MTETQYFVRRAEQEYGPWSFSQVRQFLLSCGDPHPDYPIRAAAEGPWHRASEVEGLTDIFEPASMTIRTARRVEGELKNG